MVDESKINDKDRNMKYYDILDKDGYVNDKLLVTAREKLLAYMTEFTKRNNISVDVIGFKGNYLLIDSEYYSLELFYHPDYCTVKNYSLVTWGMHKISIVNFYKTKSSIIYGGGNPYIIYNEVDLMFSKFTQLLNDIVLG